MYEVCEVGLVGYRHSFSMPLYVRCVRYVRRLWGMYDVCVVVTSDWWDIDTVSQCRCMWGVWGMWDVYEVCMMCGRSVMSDWWDADRVSQCRCMWGVWDMWDVYIVMYDVCEVVMSDWRDADRVSQYRCTWGTSELCEMCVWCVWGLCELCEVWLVGCTHTFTVTLYVRCVMYLWAVRDV